jgi:diguanylate cyclase (GGDEF)-like protein
MLLESITKGIEDLIIVVDRDTYEWLYTNHDPMRFLFNMECLKEIKELINQKVNECCIEMHERGIKDAPIQGQIELVANDDHPAQVFALTGYPIIWVDRKSAVIKLVDVTLREHEREELEQVAYYDALTNTYSRHYGMLTLERWIEEKQEFVLAFVDMDGLKYVNDTFGHVAGDEYIHATSDILSGFGKQATICRLGGDEFMLLIPKITAKQARAQLNKMRVELSKVADDKYDQSFSFGLVEVDKANTMSPSLLLSVADESMYEDKRNRKKERRAQY